MKVPVPARAMDLETEANEERLWKMLWLGGVDWKERDGGLGGDFADDVRIGCDVLIDDKMA